jgi:hypothetical protein
VCIIVTQKVKRKKLKTKRKEDAHIKRTKPIFELIRVKKYKNDTAKKVHGKGKTRKVLQKTKY